MKLYEVMEIIRLKDGNAPCKLEVETEDIKRRFATIYEGEICKYGGVDGRVNDIPAFLGGYEVNEIDENSHKDGSVSYIVYI